jgi:hypothetical protein
MQNKKYSNYEFISEKAFAKDGCFHFKKTEGRKLRDTVPFNEHVVLTGLAHVELGCLHSYGHIVTKNSEIFSADFRFQFSNDNIQQVHILTW